MGLQAAPQWCCHCHLQIEETVEWRYMIRLDLSWAGPDEKTQAIRED